jgi:hypothetical protein
MTLDLGASMGTALAGSILIAAVASSLVSNIQQSSAIPARVKSDLLRPTHPTIQPGAREPGFSGRRLASARSGGALSRG